MKGWKGEGKDQSITEVDKREKGEGKRREQGREGRREEEGEGEERRGKEGKGSVYQKWMRWRREEEGYKEGEERVGKGSTNIRSG